MDEMDCLLQQPMMPFHLDKRKALWHMIISKFHTGEACEFPSLETLIKGYDKYFNSIKGSSNIILADDVKDLVV